MLVAQVQAPDWLPREQSRSAPMAASCLRWMRVVTRYRFSESGSDGAFSSAEWSLRRSHAGQHRGARQPRLRRQCRRRGPNYTGFTLNLFGQLQPLANSTVSLPNGSQPTDVLFNGPGTSLVGTRVGITSEIDSFTVGRNGLLIAAPDSPLPAQGLGPFGSEFRPTNPQQLFVSNAHNVGPGTGTISAFNVAFNGSLTSIGATPFADDQTAPCWIEITHDGQFLFTVNTGSGEISRYAIAPNGSLTLLGSTPVSNTGGVGAVDARLSNDGRTLYVDESRVGAVGAFAVNGGNLTELPSSPVSLPAGATPAGIVTTGF